jgi:FkbM family methyltransferase
MIERLVETVVVTTYARPDSLALLLDDLERDAPAGGLDVRVYDDATPNPATEIAKRVRALGGTYRRAAANHGKRNWWQWWNVILEDLRRTPARLFYVLQDDMRLCDGFFDRSTALWESIADPRKASLYLHLSAERGALGSRCWTPVRATRDGEVAHCGWVDCAAFMGDRRLFEAIGWTLQPVAEHRWRSQEIMSSGVGQQISLRAHRAGLRLYRVSRSLTVHDCSPSLMSAAARERWTMETVDFIDGDEAARERTRVRPEVLASVASIAPRERGLRRVVESILPQVDRLGVFLNDYKRVPAFLEHDKVEVRRSQEDGLRGDAGKFAWAGSTAGYHVVCDDDLAYPPDYVDRLIDGIERHGRRAVVGFHGSILADEVRDYHQSRRLLHFASGLETDTPVHVLGTGAVAYHATAIGVSEADFESVNMADVWFALLGQRRRVPFVCLRRPPRWLTEQSGLRAGSIYVSARMQGTASRETEAVRAHGHWQLFTAPTAPAPAQDVVRRRARLPKPVRPASSPLVRVRVGGPVRGASLVLPEHDHITDAVRRTGTYYERDLLDAIRAKQPEGVFVDVGAHYGNHTTFFGVECGAERVVAIEPNPSAYAGLLETIAENGLSDVVAPRQVAAHPSWRSVRATALPWRPRHGTSVRTNSGRVGITPAERDADAPAAPLDEIVGEFDRIAVLKVDAEGMSVDILLSARRTLRRDLPLVAAEAASIAERHALRAVLSPLGYAEIGRYCWTPTWLWEARAKLSLVGSPGRL